MKRRQETLLAWLLVLPTLAILAVFVFYPAAASLYLSLHEVDAFSMHATFIGLDNYRMLLVSPE